MRLEVTPVLLGLRLPLGRAVCQTAPYVQGPTSSTTRSCCPSSLAKPPRRLYYARFHAICSSFLRVFWSRLVEVHLDFFSTFRNAYFIRFGKLGPRSTSQAYRLDSCSFLTSLAGTRRLCCETHSTLTTSGPCAPTCNLASKAANLFC